MIKSSALVLLVLTSFGCGAAAPAARPSGPQRGVLAPTEPTPSSPEGYPIRVRVLSIKERGAVAATFRADTKTPWDGVAVSPFGMVVGASLKDGHSVLPKNAPPRAWASHWSNVARRITQPSRGKNAIPERSLKLLSVSGGGHIVGDVSIEWFGPAGTRVVMKGPRYPLNLPPRRSDRDLTRMSGLALPTRAVVVAHHPGQPCTPPPGKPPCSKGPIDKTSYVTVRDLRWVPRRVVVVETNDRIWVRSIASPTMPPHQLGPLQGGQTSIRWADSRVASYKIDAVNGADLSHLRCVAEACGTSHALLERAKRLLGEVTNF